MLGLTRRTAILATAAVFSLGVGHARTSSAQDASASGGASASKGSGTSCVITGNAYVDKDTTVYSEASGGQAIGKFSGARAPLKATRFPHDASSGRVLINAGAGFRLEGFTDPRAFTVFGSRDVAVVPGHLWISASTPLKFVGASPGKVRVEHPAAGGLARPLRAWTTCDALTFDKGSRPVYEMPKRARGYVAKQGTLDLYDAPRGGVIQTLHISGAGNGLLMWGDRMRSGYVHVTMRSSIYVDAWVKYRDVRALPRGELMDQVISPHRVQSPPRLALKEYLRVMQSPKQINLHYGRGLATPVIGTIEKDAEIYVLETVVGWATVLPKKLHVVPPGDRAFWVKADELGLGSGESGADESDGSKKKEGDESGSGDGD